MTAFPKGKIYTAEDLENIPEGTRAELIDGSLYMLAAPSRKHQRISGRLHTAIDNYITDHHGNCETYTAPFDVNLFSDNSEIVQPDVLVCCDPSKFTEKGMDGAPDWIIEITSPGTFEQDYYRKLMLYQGAGVKEYWIINPQEENVSVYVFPRQYKTWSFSDFIPVSVYPGFSIRINDLL